MVISKQLRRGVAIAVSAATLAALTAAGGVLAGNTRLVYVGDPGGTADSNGIGPLTFTDTHPGGLTAVDVQVKNNGGQTLNHGSLLGGTAADNAANNPLFPHPAGTSLPAGLTFAAAFPPSGVTCNVTPASLNCNLGAFAGLASKTVRVVYQTSSTFSSASTWLGAYLNESNSTGTNQDNFFAQGVVTTGTASCTGDNADANYFLPGSNVNLATAAGCLDVVASATSKNKLTGQGGFGTLSVDPTFTDCPAGYTCFGPAVVAHVLNGGSVPGGFQTTITWYGTNKATALIHFLDTYNASDPNHNKDYDVIPFTNNFKCSAKLTTNCWVSTTASKNNADPLFFTAVVITPTNGTRRIA
jgi:hypothetical protein